MQEKECACKKNLDQCDNNNGTKPLHAETALCWLLILIRIEAERGK